jgi:hypothetical protein
LQVLTGTVNRGHVGGLNMIRLSSPDLGVLPKLSAAIASIGLYIVEAQPVQGAAAAGPAGARVGRERGRPVGSRPGEARASRWARD